MYHRMYLHHCSMSIISEESETDDDDQLDEEFILCNDNTNHQQQDHSSTNLSVENCLGDLNSFKEEIREAYEDLSTLERQARNRTSTTSTNFKIEQEDKLDALLEQLQALEHQVDQTKTFPNESVQHNKKSLSPAIVAQFDELDQALAILTITLNNVEIELADSGNSSSSSAFSDSIAVQHQQQNETNHNKHHEIDEHLSDSGLSQSTDSISLPCRKRSYLGTNSQISNTSSVISCDLSKTLFEDNKIRLALEKMHEANIKKMFIKIYNEDKSTKHIFINEAMKILDIIILLLRKYHLNPTYNYAIIEDLPDLYIYRIFEDHQNLINDAIIYWSRDTNNRICFQQHDIKYSIFMEAKDFFSIDEKLSDNNLNNSLLSNATLLPDNIANILYIKDKNRKVWRKYSCILRQSGIYQISKSSLSKRDFICLLKFDSNMQLYYANNWIESLRSPTQYGFALKYAHIQKKSNKYIHYLCVNTYDEWQRWVNGIRLIQHGLQLYKNYQQMKQIVDGGLENLWKILPTEHYFNFIRPNPSSKMSESFSTISLPMLSNRTKSSTNLENKFIEKKMNSLDRSKLFGKNFKRSSSFHDSLRRLNKNGQKISRTYSASPPNLCSTRTNPANLKRSKSTKEMTPKSMPIQHSKAQIKDHNHHTNKTLSTTLIIPFIHQCIQSEKTQSHSKPPILPSKSQPPPPPPPPIPIKLSSIQTTTTIDNHIYDSFQDSPLSSHMCSYKKNIDDEKSTVSKTHLPPMRVTDL